jgi:hypothetical protein
MAILPTSASLTSGTTTTAQQKLNLAALRDFNADLLGTDSSNKLLARSTLGVMTGVNKIINGAMAIAQRGTSFAAAISGTYPVDRWRYTSVMSSAAVTLSQQTDVPSSNEFQYSLRVAVTTADTSIGASECVFIGQTIEGFNVRDLIGRPFTVSFWVRSSKTGTHCVSLRNSNEERHYIAEYTVNAANTWEYKTVVVSAGLITAGTWNWTNGIGLHVSFALAVGANYQGSIAGSWQVNGFLSTSAQVNCLDTVGNVFAITGVQVEAGPVATPFEHRPYGQELTLCQRYYQELTENSIMGSCVTATSWIGATILPTPMRATPTYTRRNNLQVNDSAAVYTSTAADTAMASPSGLRIFNGGFTGLTTNRGAYGNNTGMQFQLSAEL